jgi:putative addiction module CopG family antidote
MAILDRGEMEQHRFGMNVTLTPDAEQYVRTKLASGEFQSADVLINEGLRVLEARERARREIREKIDVGWEQAKAGKVLSPEEVKEALVAHKAKFRMKRAA